MDENGKQMRLYQIWNGMKQRCSNKHHMGYHNYGGRGIMVCNEWGEYSNFQKWAINSGYENDLTIDRIDNEKDYAPSNCRWVPRSVQGMHTRRTRPIAFNGTAKTVAEWSRVTGIPYGTLSARLNRHGWPIEKAITTPIKSKEAI
jgi:hypothetical protein